MRSPDDLAFMDAHEEYHRARGELPRKIPAAKRLGDRIEDATDEPVVRDIPPPYLLKAFRRWLRERYRE